MSQTPLQFTAELCAALVIIDDWIHVSGRKCRVFAMFETATHITFFCWTDSSQTVVQRTVPKDRRVKVWNQVS